MSIEPNDKQRAPMEIGPPGTGPLDALPDKHTRKAKQFIPNGAPSQVFRFCALGFEYGTDDKGHAAAIVLSLCLIGLLIILFVIGAFVDRGWISDSITIIGTAFTLTAGVAIGQGAGKTNSASKDG